MPETTKAQLYAEALGYATAEHTTLDAIGSTAEAYAEWYAASFWREPAVDVLGQAEGLTEFVRLNDQRPCTVLLYTRNGVERLDTDRASAPAQIAIYAARGITARMEAA